LLLIVTLAFFSACKKSDTSSTAPIVGTWELTSHHEVYVDSLAYQITPVITDTTYTHGHSVIATFNANGTIIVTGNTQPYTGTYYTANNGVLIIISGIVTDHLQYSISGNTLTTFANESNPGFSSDQETDIYTKQ
jgi:hypothetical protein